MNHPLFFGDGPSSAPKTGQFRLDEAADAAEAGQAELGVLMMQLPSFGKNVQISKDHNHILYIDVRLLMFADRYCVICIWTVAS